MRLFLEKIAHRIWSRHNPVAWLLWPISQLLGLIVNFRFALYILGYFKQTQLAVPVIVVGNVFVGGTGKTPFTLALTEHLKKQGYKVGIISRGYRAQATRDEQAVVEVHPQSLAIEVGDEPLLMKQKTACPVFVGRHRVAVAQKLLAQYPQTHIIISDDGLQHYALARDMEIILFDHRGVGNGFLLPAGPLRESAKRRRDITVLNASSSSALNLADLGANADETFMMQMQNAVLYALHDATMSKKFSEFSHQSIIAAAGIGHPQRFFATLKAQDWDNVDIQEMPLPDHHIFTENSFAHVAHNQPIFITEKDAVKCRGIAALAQDKRIWVVQVQAHLSDAFYHCLDAKLKLV